MHRPLKGGFNEILGAVAMGSGKGKKAAKKLADDVVRASEPLQARNAGKPSSK
jgi:hypothetical protein